MVTIFRIADFLVFPGWRRGVSRLRPACRVFHREALKIYLTSRLVFHISLFSCFFITVNFTNAQVKLEIYSEFQSIFSHASDRCAPDQIPDAPARALRAPDGSVMLMASHHKNWALRGPDFAQLRPDCALLYRAAGSDVPAQHDDLVWIAALHALGNGRIVAIGHAEFHGHRRPELCPAQRYMACWWNALVPLHSDDGGRSFRRAPAPAAVAAVPYAYQSGSGRPVGYFQPSNIVRHEGHAYFYFFAEPFGAQRRGNCLLRNADPADPAGWRAWDGESFSRDLSRGAAATEADVCAPVPSAASTITGILRHAPSGGFLAVIAARRKDPRDGVEKRGVWSMWTRDLIHFGTPQLLIELPLMFAFGCEEKEVFAYPALIDPASGSPDFDSMETGADLYLTRFRPQDCKLPMARDLLRAKVRVAPQ